MNDNIEPRREVADMKRLEPVDTRFRGPGKIACYRRWLKRQLVEASDRGDQEEVERVTREMRKLGMTND